MRPPFSFDSALSPLIAVLGPTGSGKSDLAMVLAQQFAGEIVNCDSIQVYRRLEIGSAKAPAAQRERVPHHLIDVVDIDEELTAGTYSRLAREALSCIQRCNRLPIVVGGTGFYLRALLDGLSPAPVRNEKLRGRLTKAADRHPGALHRFLRKRDPQAATRIHLKDRQKLIRAVELIALAGRPVTETQSAPRDSLRGFAILKLGLGPDRCLLFERLDRRSAWIFNNGLLNETKALLDAGFSSHAKPLQSLGYKQAVKAIAEGLPIDRAVRECQTKTRHYAKRQMTWFRADADIQWLPGFGDEVEIQREALRLTREFLLGCESSYKFLLRTE